MIIDLINKLKDIVGVRKNTISSLVDIKRNIRALEIAVKGSVAGLNLNRDDQDSTKDIVFSYINEIYNRGKHIDIVIRHNKYTYGLINRVYDLMDVADEIQSACFSMSSSRRENYEYNTYYVTACRKLKEFYALYNSLIEYIGKEEIKAHRRERG